MKKFVFAGLAELILGTALSGAEPPVCVLPGDPPPCVCGDSCKCDAGKCPAACPVKRTETTTTTTRSVTTQPVQQPATVTRVVYSRGVFGRLRGHVVTQVVGSSPATVLINPPPPANCPNGQCGLKR